ncbi:hypothetical protein FOMPIDRAFT_1047046 [Fomitopsis schrenkii]|uniref:DH domain-containing protein n=1 Tax=Fomitopsis schrenkii TaxID=2126942 RepID=S8FZ96_FOMSC|nr:hypothetical protein FOMPIDRAFT_1047046 [Fomitopsis schrenkii]
MADVLTQAPLAAHVSPHGAGHPRTFRHEPLSTRSPPSSNKARLTEAARVEYISQRDLGDASATSHLRHIMARDYQHRNGLAYSYSACSTEEEGKPRANCVASSQPGRSSHIAYRHVDQDKQLPPAPEDEAPASSCHDDEPAQRQSRYDDLADALTRDPPRLSSSTPPPVPPKSDHRHITKMRTVSILEPSELSHDATHEDSYYEFNYTVSEPGHGSIIPATTSVPSSGRVPRSQTFSAPSSRYSASPYHDFPSRLSWADRASLPIYRHSLATDVHQMVAGPTSMSGFSATSSYPSHLTRRKLRKPRPVSTASSPPCGSSPSSASATPGSSSTLNLFRALSRKNTQAELSSAQSSELTSTRNSISFFRRCTSDYGHHDSGKPASSDHGTDRVKRPPVFSRQSGSGSAQSHSHSSSTSHSTYVSSSSPSDHSTPATTPDASSPVDSPLLGSSVPRVESAGDCAKNAEQILAQQASRGTGGGGGRKLRKRRPSQSASGTYEPSSLSGTPDFPGRRRWRTQSTQSSPAPPTSFNVYLPPISPVSPFGLDIPKEYTTGRRPAFLPPPKRKRSTSALAQLAWTGLSSSELAALTSRLHIQRNSPERSFQGGKGKQTQAYEEAPLGTFDPFAEGLYARGGNPKLEDVSALEEDEDNETEDTHREGSSALGHAMSSRFSTMKRMVSPRIDTQLPPSPTIAKPRANSVYVNGSTSHLRTPQHGRKSASFLESDPMAMRRWTLAMADVPDEVLVQELDKLRKNAVARRVRRKSRTPLQSDSGHTTESAYSVSPTSPWRPGVHFRLGGDSDSEDEGDGEEDDEVLDGFENDADEEEWKAARRALLCCRELVRTERSYQARLRELMSSQSSHPFFSLLLSYVPALLRASEALLVRLVDDPSAWGVGAAFIGCEEELEAALVAWCGVVGNFYIDGEDKDKRGRRRRKSGDELSSFSGPSEPRGFSAVRSASQSGIPGMVKPNSKTAETRRMSLYNAGEGGLFTAALGTGLAFGLASHPTLDSKDHGSTASIGKDHGPTGTLSRTLSAWKRKSMPSSLYNLPSAMGVPPSPTTAHGHGKEDKLFTLRDLAIQPTQRVMRYVLQYKDLLAHTPMTSPSRGLVERALESAIRIAKKCDRAQGNSAFLR